MEKSTKKKLLIGGSAVVILGIGGYFLWKYLKNKKEEKTRREAEEAAAKAAAESASSTTKGGGQTISTSNPFSSSAELLKFQQWVINTKKDASILGSAGADGVWGKKSENAWKKYGTEYTTTTKAVVGTSTSPKIVKVNATYFTDPSKMIGQKVYASSSESSLFDVEMEKIGKARKDEYLGNVTSVERTTTGGYIITLISPLKVVVKVFSSSVYFMIKQ